MDTIVVGAGPVGLTMAAELARYGVPVRIVEKAARRSETSKALVLWSRTLELLDASGCGGTFVAAGLPATAMNIIAGDRHITQMRLDAGHTPHPYALMLPQSDTERLLEQHLNALGVRVERQLELRHFSQDGEGVTLTLRHADGRDEVAQAGWLIGCDGAHSAVRHGLGMDFEGDTLPSDWILADVHLSGVPVPPNELAMFWHADGVLAVFPIAPGRYRMIADVGDGHGEARRPDPTLEQVQALLDQRGSGGMVASQPVWLSAFRINERKVADYRAGRVFLAGDAAHIHSPAGGQGMNTGMQDAINLAWKLALVCRGLAADGPLLDSYSAERSEIGRQVLRNAGRLTTLALLKGGVAQAVRNHLAALVFGLAPVRTALTNAMAELSIGYPDGPLTRPARHGVAGPAPGARAPVDAADPVGAGTSPRFALFAPALPEAATLLARHAGLIEPRARAPFNADGIWLVRPDGYVALVAGRDGWAQVDAYLRALA